MNSSIQRLLLSDRQLRVGAGSSLAERARALLRQQKKTWPLLREGYESLEQIQTRTIAVGGFPFRIQHNPHRLTSSAAPVDEESIRRRRCFLCPAHLPEEQRGILFGGNTLLLCNPYPIFSEHFTISHTEHRAQRIAPSFGTLLDLARAMQPRYSLLYNGPRCGASAPDHLHFQAGEKGVLPIEAELEVLSDGGEPLAGGEALKAVAVEGPLRRFFLLRSGSKDLLSEAFGLVSSALEEQTAQGEEPMMNILAWSEAHLWTVIVFPRRKHRPSFYFAQGDAKVLLSPAALDCAGLCITPLERDFGRLTAELLQEMFAEIFLSADAFASVRSRLREAFASL